MIYKTVTVTPTLTENIVAVTADITENITATAELTTTIRSANYEEYSGAYEFTPSAETQTLPTAERVLVQDIIINPIPSNYGLITWDGSTITVS